MRKQRAYNSKQKATETLSSQLQNLTQEKAKYIPGCWWGPSLPEDQYMPNGGIMQTFSASSQI